MIMKDGKIQKGNDAITERRDSKDISSKDRGRHLNFHDWILTREIRMLDQAYDEQIYILSTNILNTAYINDADKREEAYKELCETRDSVRATYIWRRNELKGQFGENSQRCPKKLAIEEAPDPMDICVDNIRYGGVCYTDTDARHEIAKNTMNGMFGNPETKFIFNDHSDLKNAQGITMDTLMDILDDSEKS